MSHMMFLTLAGADSLSAGRSRPAQRRRAERYTVGGEPTLRDLLTDPVTHAVMARDKVSAADLAAVVRQARARLRAA